MIVAIDGPAASGKSTTARGVALALGYDYLDTGSLYRAVTLAAIEAGVPAEEGPALQAFLEKLSLRYRYFKGKVMLRLAARDITELIRGPEIAAQVSAYSALPSVRETMVKIQRKFARGKNVVVEGRDMGTVVFPHAEVKIFLVSDPAVRARRRARDFKGQGEDRSAEEVQRDLERRDALDSGREHSPLKPAEDAVHLDNSEMSIQEQIDAVIRLVDERRPPPRISPDEILFHPSMLPEKVPPAPGMKIAYRAARKLVEGFMILAFGARVLFREREPREGGFLMAVNHIAGLDPLMASIAVRREISFVAKRELFKFKPFGALIGYFNAIPIKRGSFDRACFDKLGQTLRGGGTVLFFPEGTRKPLGRLGKAKWGLGLMAHESLMPVLPVYIKGTHRWLPAIFRRSKMEARLGRPLHIQPLLDRGLEGRELYEVFGEGVMAEIARLQDEAGGPF